MMEKKINVRVSNARFKLIKDSSTSLDITVSCAILLGLDLLFTIKKEKLPENIKIRLKEIQEKEKKELEKEEIEKKVYTFLDDLWKLIFKVYNSNLKRAVNIGIVRRIIDDATITFDAFPEDVKLILDLGWKEIIKCKNEEYLQNKIENDIKQKVVDDLYEKKVKSERHKELGQDKVIKE